MMEKAKSLKADLQAICKVAECQFIEIELSNTGIAYAYYPENNRLLHNKNYHKNKVGER